MALRNLDRTDIIDVGKQIAEDTRLLTAVLSREGDEAAVAALTRLRGNINSTLVYMVMLERSADSLSNAPEFWSEFERRRSEFT